MEVIWFDFVINAENAARIVFFKKIVKRIERRKYIRSSARRKDIKKKQLLNESKHCIHLGIEFISHDSQGRKETGE